MTGQTTIESPMDHYRRCLAANEFVIQRCCDCSRAVFYPRMLCPYCASRALKWERPSGRGTIYSTTVVRRSADKGGSYGVVLVDLEEGVRMMSTVVDREPGEIAIGDEVHLDIASVDGTLAPVFRSSPPRVSVK